MTFDKIRHVDENGTEFWLARELQEVLQYKEWRNFNKVIDTAKVACKISQQDVDNNFVKANKTTLVPVVKKTLLVDLDNQGLKHRKQVATDYRLTRYACYLIVMNCKNNCRPQRDNSG